VKKRRYFKITGYEQVVTVQAVWWTLWRRYAVYKFCADSTGLMAHTWNVRLTKCYKSEYIVRRRRSWVCQLLAASRW
jgi:hypothetical protein